MRGAAQVWRGFTMIGFDNETKLTTVTTVHLQKLWQLWSHQDKWLWAASGVGSIASYAENAKLGLRVQRSKDTFLLYQPTICKRPLCCYAIRRTKMYYCMNASSHGDDKLSWGPHQVSSGSPTTPVPTGAFVSDLQVRGVRVACGFIVCHCILELPTGSMLLNEAFFQFFQTNQQMFWFMVMGRLMLWPSRCELIGPILTASATSTALSTQSFRYENTLRGWLPYLPWKAQAPLQSFLQVFRAASRRPPVTPLSGGARPVTQVVRKSQAIDVDGWDMKRGFKGISLTLLKTVLISFQVWPPDFKAESFIQLGSVWYE